MIIKLTVAPLSNQIVHDGDGEENAQSETMENGTTKASSLRWRILRQALLHRRLSHMAADDQSQIGMKSISRKTINGFNLIPCRLVNDHADNHSASSSSKRNQSRDATVCYTLPIEGAPQLFLT